MNLLIEQYQNRFGSVENVIERELGSFAAGQDPQQTGNGQLFIWHLKPAQVAGKLALIESLLASSRILVALDSSDSSLEKIQNAKELIAAQFSSAMNSRRIFVRDWSEEALANYIRIQSESIGAAIQLLEDQDFLNIADLNIQKSALRSAAEIQGRIVLVSQRPLLSGKAQKLSLMISQILTERLRANEASSRSA